MSPDEMLQLLDIVGAPATFATSGPRYFGFVVRAAQPVASAAQRSNAGLHLSSALSVVSPVRGANVLRDLLAGLHPTE